MHTRDECAGSPRIVLYIVDDYTVGIYALLMQMRSGTCLL